MCTNGEREQFPLPSLIDAGDTTVADRGTAKDTTSNMFSFLVFNGFVSPELLVSRMEMNTNIQEMLNYEYKSPRAAVDPGRALWDPRLSADFTNGKIGNISYAHVYPKQAAALLEETKPISKIPSADVFLGNRGPEVSRVGYDAKGAASPVLALQGKSKSVMDKDGGFNIALADLHTERVRSLAFGKYTSAGGGERDDVIYFDEPDAVNDDNTFLGIFIKAGDAKTDFVSIWD